MMIFPSTELMDGKCVSLRRGRTTEPMVWHVDPVAKCREFASGGAEWMQLTDIDAIDGNYQNRSKIIEIIRQVGIPVQIGGGFNTVERISEWIDLGAGRIVVGTLAVLDPNTVKRAAKLFPDQIVVAVDVWQGSVMIQGWHKRSAISPRDFILEYARTPLAAFLVTDIDANIENKASSLNLLRVLAEVAGSPFIASGVVRNCNDILRLKQLPNVTGALVGTALFNKTIELQDALAAARPNPPQSAK